MYLVDKKVDGVLVLKQNVYSVNLARLGWIILSYVMNYYYFETLIVPYSTYCFTHLFRKYY